MEDNERTKHFRAGTAHHYRGRRPQVPPEQPVYVGGRGITSTGGTGPGDRGVTSTGAGGTSTTNSILLLLLATTSSR